MDTQRLPGGPGSSGDAWIGTVLRVSFFVGTVVIGLFLFSFLLLTFGRVVAGTVGLCATGTAANFLTMRIFDRRPFTDIGLCGGRASVVNFILGVLCGGGAAALMLTAPLLAGTGHLVLRPASGFSWA